MKDFLKMFFASVLGVLVSMFIVWFLSMVMIIGILSSLGSAKSMYALSDNTVLQIYLDGRISDRESTDIMAGLFSGSTEKSYGLDDILKAIETAKNNDMICGIYIKTGNLSAGYATLEPIRKALIDFKESGKFIVSFGDYYPQSAYYIASTADKVIMNPQGMFMLHGMSANMPFFKGMYEKLGIKIQVFKVGTFKSAVEPYTETKMSDANREQVTAYMNSIWTHILTGVSESRGITIDNLNRYADEYMDFSDPGDAVKYGLVDELMYAPNVKDYIKELAGVDESKEMKFATVSNINSVPAGKPKFSKDKIAVLYAEGAIISGENKGLDVFLGNMITDEEYVKELGNLKDDKNIKAVVFRVNSPGGSVYASDKIWHAVAELKKEKPVIVSMGDYAASGGYYISCAADVIVAEPTTLTGSIGVFSLIPEGQEMHKKIGLSFDGVKTNKFSDMGATAGLPLLDATTRPFNAEEQFKLQTYTNRIYELFLARCADGRSKTKHEIDGIGQGRVWTGSQALQNGLVDKLGSLDDAVKIAVEYAQLDDYVINTYPKKKDPFTQVMEEIMGGSVKASLVKTFLGEEVYLQYVLANGKKVPMEIVQAVMRVEN
ncbi:MAG: signal peptide peptidase SppA [Tannerella sp.]|jgi:protease-4|nr:signal peptide peptidase SppA [Tannerella sp.]